jgi:cytochrome c peroxidase
MRSSARSESSQRRPRVATSLALGLFVGGTAACGADDPAGASGGTSSADASSSGTGTSGGSSTSTSTGATSESGIDPDTSTADDSSSGGTPIDPVRELLRLPDHLETPYIPEFNPLTAEKIELGRHLFYDRRLSGNLTQACADCHFQELGFADGERTPTGSTGTVLERNSQGLGMVAYNTSFTWASNVLLELEDQLQVPLRNDNPVELGINDGNEAEVLARFDDDPMYAEMFAAAFPESESGATVNKIVFALASFCRTMIPGRSPYDRFVAGDDDALTEQQRAGMTLFFGERFECFHCHNGINLTTSYRDADSDPGSIMVPFFNNGLYNVNGDGSYPAYDQGLYEVTFDPDHRGLFRPPSLRNIAVTAPYMHDGSKATLRDVLDHYAAGGTVTESGPYAGDGRVSPLKSGLVRGFAATDEEIDAVIAFLESMTDDEFLVDPAFANPFEQ